MTVPTARAMRAADSVQGRLEQLLVLGGRLVFDGQRLGVVRATALYRLLAFLGGRLQLGVREVLEQPADVVRRVGGEDGAAKGLGQHRGFLPFGWRVSGAYGTYEGTTASRTWEVCAASSASRPPGACSSGVSAAESTTAPRPRRSRHPRRCRRSGRRGRRPGRRGRGRPDGCVSRSRGRRRREPGNGWWSSTAPRRRCRVLQGRAEPQRRVHQLLEAEDEYAAGVAARASAMRAAMAGRADSSGRAVCGGEAVPAAVGQPGRPVQLHSGAEGVGRSPRYRRSGPGCGAMPRAAARASAARSWAATSACPFSRTPSGQADRARGPRHQVDAGADLRGELGRGGPRSAGDRMSTRATITYRSRG